ncbi:MAG: SMC-Scp complex subunit ScpB, partial [Acidiferrobacterales bacterium]
MTDAGTELRNIIEAALLVAGQALTVDRMLSLFPETSRPSREEIRAALGQLELDYADRAMELRQIDHGYRLQTKERYAEWIVRLSEERPVRYSRALLETLAIIAYRQPVTRGEIEDIRGVAVSSEIIKTLLGREWIRQVGQREVPGRPSLYGTTRAFLEHFNLRSLDELPPLAELRDVEKIGAALKLALPEDAQTSEEGIGAPAAGSGEEPEGQASASAEVVAQMEAEAGDVQEFTAQPEDRMDEGPDDSVTARHEGAET